MVTIGGHKLSVSKATVNRYKNAYTPPEFHGSAAYVVAVEVECSEWRLGDERYEPRIYHETLTALANGESLAALAGRSFEWTLPFRADGEPNGAFYVWQHSDVLTGTVTFGAVEDEKIALEWTGTADLRLDEEGLERRVPFRIKTHATLES